MIIIYYGREETGSRSVWSACLRRFTMTPPAKGTALITGATAGLGAGYARQANPAAQEARGSVGAEHVGSHRCQDAI
jgi:hypothetical protein